MVTSDSLYGRFSSPLAYYDKIQGENNKHIYFSICIFLIDSRHGNWNVLRENQTVQTQICE